MGDFPPPSISLGRRALLAAPLAQIQFPLLFLVTGSFARPECLEITEAVGFVNASSWDGNCRRDLQSERVGPIEFGRPRLNNQPKIDISVAANIVSTRLFAIMDKSFDYAGFRHEYIG